MLFDRRLVTLLGATSLFAVVSILFILKPHLGPGLFPLYALLFVWTDARRETEIHVIFLFLVSIAGVALVATAPPLPAGLSKFIYLAELAAVWLYLGGLGAHRRRLAVSARVAEEERRSLESQALNAERELAQHQGYQQTAARQIILRRDMTEAVRALGSTLDGREVHVRLAGALSARFAGSRVEIAAGAGHDPLLILAGETGAPVLVRDSLEDSRLKGPRFHQAGGAGAASFRSGMAAPLRVMRQAAGFIKVEADSPGAFALGDLQTLDLFATLAALSLENIRFYETVQEQATHDSLTQLYSHRAFQARLQEEVLRAGRSQTPVALIMADVDHFKTYNDRYGHQAGDQLLRGVSAILLSFARPVDFAARYGGEEFCLIVPNAAKDEAMALAENIRARIAAEGFAFQGSRTAASVSFGVSCFPQDATTASQVVRVADERLYQAKRGGRNRVAG